MLRIQLKCGSEERRQALRDSALNAIDYLEVLPRTEAVTGPLLLLCCFKPDFLSELEKDNNILIEGGVRIRDLGVTWLQVAKTVIENLGDIENDITKDLANEEKTAIQNIEESDRDRILIIRPSRDGDFSMYTLRLIHDPDNRELPPSGFDPILSQIDFTFKILCPTHFDCKVERVCPPEITEEPIIDYMAKDYASFRRLMLDRMAAIMPTWKERNPADLGIVLVELLAYVGDHLSYYQDAVATESYLGTARRRASVRRHARLLNYFMHDGCNARTWIYMKVSEDTDLVNVPKKTKLLTGVPDPYLVVREENLEEAIREGGRRAEVFETMHDVTLYRHHNEILFYTWGEPKCCLPKGATCSTLKNDGNRLDVYLFNWKDVPGSDSNALKDFLKQNFSVNWIEDLDIEKIAQGTEEEIIIRDGVHHLSILLSEDKAAASLIIEGRVMHKFTVKQEDADLKVYTLSLKVGDYLLFEEVRSPSTLARADADPSNRHVVRLTKVEPDIDELNGTRLVEIAWDPKDAMPFPLCLWEVPKTEGEEEDEEGDEGEEGAAMQFKQLSVARGNIVLADHGNTVKERLQDRYDCGSFRPFLSLGPLTHRGPFDLSYPASSTFTYEMQEVSPDIYIEEYEKEIDCSKVEAEEGEEENAIKWFATRDLLSSNRFSREFVAEIENDDGRTAQIRFGDDTLGMEPTPGT